jgi:hypothetical protein
MDCLTNLLQLFTYNEYYLPSANVGMPIPATLAELGGGGEEGR